MHGSNSKRNPFHRNRALRNHKLSKRRRQFKLEPPIRSLRRIRRNGSSASSLAVPSTWPCTTWPPSGEPAGVGSSRFTTRLLTKLRQSSASDSLGSKISREARRKRMRLNRKSRKANAIHSNAVTRIEPAASLGAAIVIRVAPAAGSDIDNLASSFDQTGKHKSILAAKTQKGAARRLRLSSIKNSI